MNNKTTFDPVNIVATVISNFSLLIGLIAAMAVVVSLPFAL